MADAPSAAQNPRSTTPDNKQPLNISGTPIAYRQSGSMPHSTADDSTATTDYFYRLMALEIQDKIISDVDVELFLETFLEKPKSMRSRRKSVAAPSKFEVELANIRGAENELAMYKPFVNAFNLNLKNTILLDSHSKGFPQLRGADVKPDVVLSLDRSRDVVNISMADVAITIEMKFSEGVDPFDTARNNQDQVSTLGQISAYAAAQLAAQFCTHVFSVLVFPNFARLLRWDRAGVVVSKKIPFETPESAMVLTEFFRRFDLSSPLERGVDPHVTIFSESDFDTFKTPEGGEDIKTALQYSSNPTVVYRKITFPDAVLKHTKPRAYIVSTPYYMGTMSVVGRSTRSFRAYSLQTGKIVFLKDTWRVLESSTSPEHETYAKLAAAKVSHVATAIDYHDMEDQKTHTTDLEHLRSTVGESTFRSFLHYRLVLKEYARNIEEFKDVKELLTAFCHTIRAHHEACHKAKILHRDISSGNLMITDDGQGLLVDWDFSKPIGTVGPRSPERTGTWQFIAYRLVEARLKRGPFPDHNEDDDLESFWYVLYWLALRRCEHMASNKVISAELKMVFDGSFQDDEGVAVAHSSKFHSLKNDQTIDVFGFVSPPLSKILKEYQGVIVLRYKLQPAAIEHIAKLWMQVQKDYSSSSEKTQIKELGKVLIDNDIQYGIAAHARLLSNSKWAQNMFADVLRNEPLSSWDIGGENIRRNLGDIFRRSGLTSGQNKRKDISADPGNDPGRLTSEKRKRHQSDLTRIPEGPA